MWSFIDWSTFRSNLKEATAWGRGWLARNMDAENRKSMGQNEKISQSKDQRGRWVEPWYLAYALSGATTSGMSFILLPLIVSRTSGAGHIGLVMAAFNLGGLTAPFWGSLADRYGLHRWMLFGGLLMTTIGLTAFPFTTNKSTYLGLALLQSMGAAAAATVANLFVVEGHPQDEWDERIGWLQTFYGGGQVGGLLLAGVLSQVDLRAGLLVAAGLTLLAALVGGLTTSTLRNPPVPRPVLLYPGRHSEWIGSSPQRFYHHLNLVALRQIELVLRSPFGLFIIVWLVTFAGSSAFFSFYPVLMRQLYDVAPGLSSVGFAIAAGAGLTLYSPAGRWSDRFGPARVLRAALGVRLLAFLSLLALGVAHVHQAWLAMLSFLFVVLAWSLLSVSGTALTAQLSPVGEGEGMGIFNAATALAGTFGAVLGGWISEHWGYNGAIVLAIAGIAFGLVFTAAKRADPGRLVSTLQVSAKE
jgi:DHA1 family tetracycline resistance protein-like MFS transporter